MPQFRLPRKTKKSLKRTLWLYPADEKGNSLMAVPTRLQKDYDAVKQGIVKDILNRKNAKERRREFREKMDKEVSVSDEQLLTYVNDIMAAEFRNSSYNTLIEAKNDTVAITAYYNFINAYHLVEKGEDSFGNICCLAVDSAKELLKKNRKQPKGRKRR